MPSSASPSMPFIRGLYGGTGLDHELNGVAPRPTCVPVLVYGFKIITLHRTCNTRQFNEKGLDMLNELNYTRESPRWGQGRGRVLPVICHDVYWRAAYVRAKHALARACIMQAVTRSDVVKGRSDRQPRFIRTQHKHTHRTYFPPPHTQNLLPSPTHTRAYLLFTASPLEQSLH